MWEISVVGGRRVQTARRRVRHDVDNNDDDGMGFVRSAIDQDGGASEQGNSII